MKYYSKAVYSIDTGLYDGCQSIWRLATGNEWESVTAAMWKNIITNLF